MVVVAGAGVRITLRVSFIFWREISVHSASLWKPRHISHASEGGRGGDAGCVCVCGGGGGVGGVESVRGGRRSISVGLKHRAFTVLEKVKVKNDKL